MAELDPAKLIQALPRAIAEAKSPLLRRMMDWAAPRIAAGEIVDLPPALLEMLLVGPVAETVRRWLAGAPGVDLKEAAVLLPERVWRSVSAR